jgi:hypothetical protein
LNIIKCRRRKYLKSLKCSPDRLVPFRTLLMNCAYKTYKNIEEILGLRLEKSAAFPEKGF